MKPGEIAIFLALASTRSMAMAAPAEKPVIEGLPPSPHEPASNPAVAEAAKAEPLSADGLSDLSGILENAAPAPAPVPAPVAATAPKASAAVQEKAPALDDLDKLGMLDPAEEKQADLPLLAGSAEASKVVEGIDEDKITAEIEDLQHKLGVLQANIDKVLNEGKTRRRKRDAEEATKLSDVDKMAKQLDDVLKTVGSLQMYLSSKLKDGGGAAAPSAENKEEKAQDFKKEKSSSKGKESDKDSESASDAAGRGSDDDSGSSKKSEKEKSSGGKTTTEKSDSE